MIYAKFTAEGVLDWTSEIQQEGLVEIKLPLVNEGDEIRLNEKGEIEINRKEADAQAGPFTDLEALTDNFVISAFLMALNSYAPLPEETDEGEARGVSILIPCFGKAAWVKEAVQSAVSQTKPAEEIRVLLMDEESQAMQSELEALGENVVCEARERMDVCAARNYLAQTCKSEYFVFLDADDLLAETFIEQTTRGAADFVFPLYNELKDGKTVEPDLLFQNKNAAQSNLTALFRKEAFFDLGGLDSAFADVGREDTDFILTVLESGKKARLETETCFTLRRDKEDAAWLASSFSYSETYILNNRKSADMILEKHREAVKRNFEERGFYPGISILPMFACVLRRYIETGDEIHLQYLAKETGMFREKQAAGYFLRREKERYAEAFPARAFGECPEFTGDWENWRFVNCEPAEAEKAQILNHCAGRAFDVLFLSRAVNGAPDFEEILSGAEKAMVRRDAVFSETEGARFRAEAAQRYFCAYLPLYDLDPGFTDEDLRFTNEIAQSKEAAALVKVKQYEQTYGRPYSQTVTFELNKECNRDCAYCTQARGRPFPHYDDDEIFARFDKLLTHLEKLAPGRIAPQIMGGEPTLWSEELIEKIVARLSDYPDVAIVTNHDRKDSAWEKCPKVRFYTHIVDWEDAGKITPQGNEGFMIVVTKQNLPYLEDFISANEGVPINIDAYIGEDENLALSDEDRAKIAKIEAKYEGTDDAILKSVESGYKSILAPSACVRRTNIWRADCTSMTVCPCCGRNQKVIPYEEFTGQLPCLEDCGDCAVLYRFENFLL